MTLTTFWNRPYHLSKAALQLKFGSFLVILVFSNSRILNDFKTTSLNLRFWLRPRVETLVGTCPSEHELPEHSIISYFRYFYSEHELILNENWFSPFFPNFAILVRLHNFDQTHTIAWPAKIWYTKFYRIITNYPNIKNFRIFPNFQYYRDKSEQQQQQ